jgi:hypothetical protein
MATQTLFLFDRRNGAFQQSFAVAPSYAAFRFAFIRHELLYLSAESTLSVMNLSGGSWRETQRIALATDLSSIANLNAIASDDHSLLLSLTENGRHKAALFQKTNGLWFHRADILPQSPFLNYLGIGISGNSVLLGAFRSNPARPEQGQCVVFALELDGTNTLSEQILSPPSGGFEDVFGHDLVIDEDWAFIANAYVKSPGLCGVVYAYRRLQNRWEFTQTILPDMPMCDGFSASLAFRSGKLLVGAPGRPEVQDHTGAAFLFEFSGDRWIERHKFVDPHGETGDLFGMSVALEGDTCLIGAPGKGDGALFVYQAIPQTLHLRTELLPERLRISWPATFTNVVLEASSTITGPWQTVNHSSIQKDGFWLHDSPLEAPATFYRLHQQ